MIHKAYKYRLYPNRQQAELLNKHFGCVRLIYNLALETRKEAYRRGYRYSAYELQGQLPDLKSEHTFLKEINAQSLQIAIHNMDRAFVNFFKGQAKSPQFKSKNHKQACKFINGTAVNFEFNKVRIPKVGYVKARLPRYFEGDLKSITVTRTKTGKYFASCLIEEPHEIPEKPGITNAIGIDLGIKDFAVLSDGTKIDNPKHLKNDIERLKVLQKRASRKQKGSNNRRKANLKVAGKHERIANRRQDFLHKLTDRLTKSENQAIVVENLAVSNLIKNHKLAQAISDVSWSEFVRQLKYKCEWRGKHLIKIDRYYPSTKTCHCCGHINESLTLQDREWTCKSCGTLHDRDVNAAINIKNAGTGCPGGPVESLPLGRAKKQEYSCSNNSE